MMTAIEQILFFSAGTLLIIPSIWLGYLIAGNLIFWNKYEKDSPLFDEAPVGNWPDIAVLAILDDSDPEPWIAVKSALSQNYTNKEIIVVANGVKQDTLLTALEHLNGESFRILEFNQKVPLTDIYNLALKITKAPSLFVAHPGVVLEPDVITKLSMQLYQDSRVGVVYATQELIKAQTISQLSNNISIILEALKKKASRIYGKLLVHNEKCALFRTNALIDIGGFEPNAPNVIAAAGWRVQTLFWSARFESRARYHVPSLGTGSTVEDYCNNLETQDAYILKSSKELLWNPKQKRLLFPYLNPIFRRIFYTGEFLILLPLFLINPFAFLMHVFVLGLIVSILVAIIASQLGVKRENSQITMALLLLLYNSCKNSVKPVGDLK